MAGSAENGRPEAGSREIMRALTRAVEKEFETLNPQQRAAALHGEGRALCIAGPGSGKTAVISRRAARLGLVGGAGGPLRGRVLTLAFNRAACREMRERGDSIVGRILKTAGIGEDGPVTGGSGAGVQSETAGLRTDYYTIHGYCYRIVRDYCARHGMRTPGVLDQAGEDALVREAFFEISGGIVGQEILKVFKNYNMREHRVMLPAGDYKVLFKLVKEQYSAMKRRDGVIDFGDMLELALEYLRVDREFRRQVASSYDYVQVDEAQDLSGMQADIVGLISPGNIFFVADDDQSIYGFRGSDPEVVRRLGEDAAVYMLERNYRSKSEITDAASLFIKSNIRRFSKNLTADKGRGGRVVIKAFASELSQGRFAVNRILDCVRKRRTVCVLYRNNAGAAVVLTLLYFALRSEQAGSALRSGQAGSAPGSWKAGSAPGPGQAAGRSPEIREGAGASAARIDGERTGIASVHIAGERTRLSEIPYTRLLYEELKRAEAAYVCGARFRAAVPTPATLYRRLEKSGVVDIIGAETMAGRRKFYVENVKAAVKIIVGNAESCEMIPECAAEIDALGDRGSAGGAAGKTSCGNAGSAAGKTLYGKADSAAGKVDFGKACEGDSGVYFSTIHSAKGLEYDTVIIIDCVKGEIPFGSPAGDALFEERRLMYVAMTRAASELYITYPRRCGKLELEPGEFLEEMREG